MEGVGLHTGKRVAMRLKPARHDTGIVFVRKDRRTSINAELSAVCDTAFATTIGVNGTRVKTVEHLLAALSGLGVDNLHVELDGPEVPILDGSSAGFVGVIMKAGIKNLALKRAHLRVLRPVFYKEGHTEISVYPSNGRSLIFHTFYKHPMLGEQEMSINLDEEDFASEIAPARTFGFLCDVEMLRKNGLAKGGSLENAIILGENDILNENGLRFEDEFLRHKVLDFIGDLSLIGFPIYGHIVAVRAGHTANVRFLRTLMDSPDAWEITTEAAVPTAIALS